MALSVGLPRPGVTRHRFFPESGLSSPTGYPVKAAIRPSAHAGLTCVWRGASMAGCAHVASTGASGSSIFGQKKHVVPQVRSVALPIGM